MRQRALPVLLTGAVVVVALAGVAVPAAAAPAPAPAAAGGGATTFVVAASTVDPVAGDPVGVRAFTGPEVSRAATTTRRATFVGTDAAGGRASVTVTAPAKTVFTTSASRFPVAPTADRTSGTVVLTWGDRTCTAARGTVDVLRVWSPNPPATRELALQFSVACTDGRTGFNGQLRQRTSTSLPWYAYVADAGLTDLGTVGIGQSRTVTLPVRVVATSSGSFGPEVRYRTDDPDFRVTRNTCGETGLFEGETCSVTLTYTPHTAGRRVFQLSFVDSVYSTSAVAGVGG